MAFLPDLITLQAFHPDQNTQIPGVTNLPCPDVHHHVILVPHADDVLVVGRESHAGDAVLVLLKLGHLTLLCDVPQSHDRQVSALRRKREKQGELGGEYRENVFSSTLIYSPVCITCPLIRPVPSPVPQPVLTMASYRLSEPFVHEVNKLVDRRSEGDRIRTTSGCTWRQKQKQRKTEAIARRLPIVCKSAPV